MFTRKSDTEAGHHGDLRGHQDRRGVEAGAVAERYAVLRQAGTEPAWSGELLHVDGEGVFRCAGCGAELFDTDAKFDSGIGLAQLRPGPVRRHHHRAQSDRTFGMARTEILCARCGGHLGHVFPDGPTDTGLRYCVNSLSLTYEPDAAGG